MRVPRGIRTPDLFVRSEALYPLSYRDIFVALGQWDLNPRPSNYEFGALPAELWPIVRPGVGFSLLRDFSLHSDKVASRLASRLTDLKRIQPYPLRSKPLDGPLKVTFATASNNSWVPTTVSVLTATGRGLLPECYSFRPVLPVGFEPTHLAIPGFEASASAIPPQEQV